MPFGIDLGTTNSSIAWTDAVGAVHSLRVRRGPKRPFDSVEPSLVLLRKDEPAVIGDEARTAARQRSGGTLVRSFKRRFDKQRLREYRYEVRRDRTYEYDPVNECVLFAETHQRVPINYDTYSRVEVIAAAGAMFARLLSSDEIVGEGAVPMSIVAAEAATDELIYVGAPITFGPTARRRLLAALAASGWFGTGAEAYAEARRRCRIVYEPLALIATLPPVIERSNVLFFDYGGGTLDLAVLDVEPGHGATNRVAERALGGLPRAGDAIDAAFRESLLGVRPALAKTYRRQVASGSAADIDFAEAAFANAKIRLSTAEAVTLPVFDQEVTRGELDAAVKPLVDEAVAATIKTIEHAGLNPADIDSVLMTGGSSLIPLVQTELRALFPDLDELSFVAGTPGDEASELNALTGISRGLASFAFLESFESTAPCNFSAVVPGVKGEVVCVKRGDPNTEDIMEAPPAPLEHPPDRPLTVAVYSDLVTPAYCGAVVDLDVKAAREIEIRISADRERFAPAFGVFPKGGKRPIATFDLDRMSAPQLEAFVEGDNEWLPNHSEHVSSSVLTRPLRLGDMIEWRHNGTFKRGKIVTIRDFESGQYVERTDGFDPAPYIITAAVETDRVVQLGVRVQGNWKIGDVRLL